MKRRRYTHLAKQGLHKFSTHHFHGSMLRFDLCVLVLKDLPAPFRNKSAHHFSFQGLNNILVKSKL